MKQIVRIIGGRYRGRKLPFPAIPGLRPTPDRVRETLFNWLMNDISDATILDAFSGSGALAFEAISRGAKQVVMIEFNKKVAKTLHQQAKLLDVDNANIICVDILKYLQETDKTFDIIFIDPPFDSQLLQPTIDLIMKRRLLSEHGLMYVETRVNTPFQYPLMQLMKEKKAGQVCYRLLKR